MSFCRFECSFLGESFLFSWNLTYRSPKVDSYESGHAAFVGILLHTGEISDLLLPQFVIRVGLHMELINLSSYSILSQLILLSLAVILAIDVMGFFSANV